MRFFRILKRPNTLLFLVIALIFLTRFWFLGSSLWHDDAFNFVDKAVTLAVDGQYINAHSTGYPLWIGILAGTLSLGHMITGKWLIILMPNLITAIFGALLVLPLFKLTKKVFAGNDYYALLATIIILINPMLWRWSEIAMSDIPALFFVLYSLTFFYNFLDDNKRRDLILSGVFLYLSLMIRPVYGLILLIFAFSWLYRYRFNELRKAVKVFASLGIFVFLSLLSYFFINNNSFQVFFSSYGSVAPSLSDIYHTTIIALKTLGPLIPLVFIGAWYLFKQNREFFYVLAIGAGVFTLYAASWYTNGSFDIERYNLIAIVLLLLLACYSLIPNWGTRGLFAVTFTVSFFILISGLSSPVNFYRTYASNPNIFTDYKLKSGQVSQQKLTDGDVQLYQDLADNIDQNALVLRWDTDWIIPKLLFAGAHLSKPVEVIGVGSEEDILEQLKQADNHRVYLLRGAYETLLQANQEMYEIKSETLNKRSIVYFVDLQ